MKHLTTLLLTLLVSGGLWADERTPSEMYFEIHKDENSAHASYINDGIFKTIDNESVISNWLESVYLVKEKGELKLKFLQSDLVSRETK